LNENPLALSEIFCSLQGESTRAGLPCVFIRLAGCNLRCHWCDTRYSYKPAFQMSIPEIVERVLEYHPVTLVCLTGGEPLLQRGSVALMQQQLDAGCTVTLETNGSLPLDAVPQAVERICDMKCPGSGVEDSFLSINLRQLHAGRDQLKFVLAHRNDYDYARHALPHVPAGVEVLFSPVLGLLTPRDLAAWIIADRLPVRMQLQMHKLVWGAEARGV